MAGRLDAVRDRFEESTRLRRELGFLPGAADLIGLAHLAARQVRREEAAELLRDAVESAAKAGAEGALRWVAEAREDLDLSGGDEAGVMAETELTPESGVLTVS
jgi:hypothetical protein